MTDTRSLTLFSAPSGRAIIFHCANVSADGDMHFSLGDDDDFGPVKIVSSGWHGPNHDEQKLTFVVIPPHGYHADKYLPGAVRFALTRGFNTSELTIDDELYTHQPNADLTELTLRKVPTVSYDGDKYRRFFDQVRQAGWLTLSSLMSTDYRDCWPGFNVDRGDCVRGEYHLVTADPSYPDGALAALSEQLGRPMAFATTYELMDFALKGWDGKTEIVCAGTRAGLAREPDYSSTDPAFFYLHSSSPGDSIDIRHIRDFEPSEILCVVVEP